MSVWVESNDEKEAAFTASMTDVIFRIDCQCLPVDHAAALSVALCDLVPWLKLLPAAGVHPIHVAGSQNGWQRPEKENQSLLLSKRTRLRIRIDTDRHEKLIQSLENKSVKVGQHTLKILTGRIAPLQPVTTLFSRYTFYLQNDTEPSDENAFVQQVINQCKSNGYTPTKVLCGRSGIMVVDGKKIPVRSVMLADVPVEHSLPLQERGLGDLRLHGCGILIPHKDTAAVN